MTLQGAPCADMLAVMDGSRILVVDDDADIRTLLSDFLEQHGFAVTAVPDGARMDEALAAQDFDIAVLDVMMPGEDGLSILRRLSARGGLPVIMLSAIGSDIDRIVGLEMGAEDYLPKPCNPRELLARVRTVLRRHRRQVAQTPEAHGKRLRFAGWQVDMGARLLTDPENVVVTLTDGEFRLLRAFIEHPRRVLSRDQLLDYSAGSESDSYDRAIDVQVSRLRRKLERGARAEGTDELVRTIRNEGYMFTAEVRPV
ncbi:MULTISPECIES: response regulator [Sphingobium]|jgi:two-component system OmpR family response regulator|uniref:response regulator n=1 Tax=Sphingobium TaxID=165695 RepID=UPI000E73E16D|nr:MULTISPECIES: response regulator [Sphingobium]KAA9012191.1 response regulator [Sphingobium limneticum]MBU0932662.1 response regulator [Alphaproteobacteria bacterium]